MPSDNANLVASQTWFVYPTCTQATAMSETIAQRVAAELGATQSGGMITTDLGTLQQYARAQGIEISSKDCRHNGH